MTGNYYATKIKNKLLKMPVFVICVGIYIFVINLFLSWPTIRDGSLYYSFRHPINYAKVVKINITGNEEWIIYAKISYMVITLAASFISAKWIYEMLIRKISLKGDKGIKAKSKSDTRIPPFPLSKDNLQFTVGLSHDPNTLDEVHDPKWVTIPELGMYMDTIIIGGKGLGKTQSVMYPAATQIINYKSDDPDKKVGLLILDVKGNFYEKIETISKSCGRENDVIIIELDGKYKYNMLYKPDLESLVLAKRIRLILDMFAGKSSNEAYWLDTAETIIDNAIKLARLRYNGYFTFHEINRIANSETFFKDTIAEIHGEIEAGTRVLTPEENFDLESVENYYLYEFSEIKPETKAIFSSEISRMIRPFISNFKATQTFCSSKDELNFMGFKDLINKGLIVVLKMNYGTYASLSKIVAAYLKLDFQQEVLSRMSNKCSNDRSLSFICDEYHIFVTSNDYDFYSLSREAKCCNIVATQSYSSLLENLHSMDKLRVLMTNLKNKIFLETDDKLTIDEAKVLFGKEEKKRERISISEGADHEGKYISTINKVASTKGTSFNRSVSYETYKDYKFSEEAFTTELQRFKALAFLHDGQKVLHNGFLHLVPVFDKSIYGRFFKEGEL